jgi:hypothetical protein
MHASLLLVTPRSSYLSMESPSAAAQSDGGPGPQASSRNRLSSAFHRACAGVPSYMAGSDASRRDDVRLKGVGCVRAACFYGSDPTAFNIGDWPDVLRSAEIIKADWRRQGRHDIADEIVVKPC